MKTFRNLLMSSVVFAPDEAAAAGASVDAGASAESVTADTILYGDAASDVGADKSADAAPEWKEYEPDTTKSDEENAALKTEHDKTKPVEGDKKDEDPDNVVPEDGKYDIQLPDGLQVDQELLDGISPAMKEIGLTKGQASKLAAAYAEQGKKQHDALQARHDKVVQDWQAEIKTDKDFGGDKLKDSINTANRVIATFGDDAFRRDLKDLGIGNHPGLFRLLARVGNALSDDKPVASETPAASQKKDHAETLYGTD